MATRSLLQRLRSPGLRKRLTLICWLILAAFLALYGVTTCLALLGGVNLHPILIPLLKALIRPLEIGACLMYPLACWLGWTRRSLAPSWNLDEWSPSLSAPLARPEPQDHPPGRRWRKLLFANVFGMLYCVVVIPAAIAMLTFYGITSTRSDGLAAILSQWNYPLAGFHILAGCIAFIAGRACAYTQHRSSAPSREARER